MATAAAADFFHVVALHCVNQRILPHPTKGVSAYSVWTFLPASTQPEMPADMIFTLA